jgi:hypothetical protein
LRRNPLLWRRLRTCYHTRGLMRITPLSAWRTDKPIVTPLDRALLWWSEDGRNSLTMRCKSWYDCSIPMLLSHGWFGIQIHIREASRQTRPAPASKDGSIMLIVGVRDEHYFRGNENIYIEFEELFQFFNQDVVDKSLMSFYFL